MYPIPSLYLLTNWLISLPKVPELFKSLIFKHFNNCKQALMFNDYVYLPALKFGNLFFSKPLTNNKSVKISA